MPAGAAVRIVADTNVIISALLWDGTPHEILILAEANQVTLCFTQPMLDELSEVLERPKFKKRLQQRRTSVEEIIAGLVPLVELYAPIMASGSVPVDPDDEIFIACALSADVGFLVSGDDHLLNMKQYGKIQILTPAEFLAKTGQVRG